MLFSVIVPVYNVEDYLQSCLESIKGQSYADFECILVDDGSTDRSADICDEYCIADSRFKVLHKTNEGLVSARQAGAKIAQGEYIVCVDSDDWIADSFLERFAGWITQTKADVLSCGIIWYYSEGRKLKSAIPLDQGFYDKCRIDNELSSFLIHDNNGRYFPPSVCGKAFKRDLYLPVQLVIDTATRIGEDMLCTYPCVNKAGAMYCSKDYLYYYRQNEQSMTQKKAFDLYGAKLVGMHLAENIDISAFDYESQIDRLVVHLLFNSCVSQFFQQNRKYREICEEIKAALCDDYYKKAIEKCRFSAKYIKGVLALLALKYRAYILMKIYALYKEKL